MPLPWKPQQPEVYKAWVTAILDEASEKLDSWESDFIASIANLLELEKPLTEKQAKKLESIYADYTS